MLKLMQKLPQSCLQRLGKPLASLLLGGTLLLGIGSNSVGIVRANVNYAHTAATHTLSRTMLNRQNSARQLPTLRTEALMLQQQLEQKATAWSKQHPYVDSYDGITYQLGYEYQAIANYPTQNLLDRAQSVADYQYIIGQLQGWLADFAAYTTNFSATMPYNQVHATDLQLMQQNSVTSEQKIIIISLAEQAMRVYQHGQLIHAFQVVTGKPEHPSLPGSWQIESKVTNTTFTSGKQPGQDGYYPPTPIALAMQYHSDGYFVHQSWWRSQYGPYKQFPHMDTGGTLFANDGSHGCINMSTADVTWLYNFAQVNMTKVIIY
jgi:lipoprotein-anchoring transpeptidase ErfK/SrfK